MRIVKILILLCLVVALHAKKVTLYSQSADGNTTRIHAKKRVALVYKEYYIQADRAEYIKAKKLVKLYGNVVLIEDGKYSSLSDFAILDLASDRIYAFPYFFTENSSQIWMGGKYLFGKKGYLKVKHSAISSCDSGCSDWKIGFSRGYFYKEKHWVDLYHTKLYIKDTPIFYFPYIGFSTLKTRHTGFLRPSLGLSKDEGFIYIQPFYIAEQNWWDLELDPQIRTDRGQGIYGTFRFVDSPYSYGEFRTGYFKEKSRYFEGHNIKNTKHFGWEFFYKRRNIFTDPSKSYIYDSLYTDLKFYNDIDYFNLQKSDSRYNSHESLTVSRINYANFRNLYYFRVYFKYFKNNLKADNSDTLQLLPSLQLHRFETPLFGIDNLTYLFDFTLNNYYRKKGLKAVEYRLDLPVTLQRMFFDDLFGVSISENLFFDYADYSNDASATHYENSYIIRNAHMISLFSDLVKPYDNFTHNLHLRADLVIPSYEKIRGDQANFINIEDQKKHLALKLENYFLDRDGKQKLYYILRQNVNYDEAHKFQDLENEIGYQITDNLNINSDVFFSYRYHTLSTLVTTLSYHDGRYNLYLSHFYKDRKEGNEDSNYLRLSLSNVLSKKYKLFATIDYDFNLMSYRNWSVGINIYKKCWDFMIGYKREHLPILTTGGINAYLNQTLFFRINFYPLGGIAKSFTTSQLQGSL